MIAGPVIDRLRRVDQDRLDVALAVVLAAITLLGLGLAPASTGGRGRDVLANVLALAMTLPIAFRRRRPVLVLAITVLATTLAALTGPSSGVGLAVLIAVYSVAAHANRRQSLTALTLTLVAVTVVVTIVVTSSDPGLSPAILAIGLVLAWMIFGAVWLLGDLVQSRGEAVAELRQRNAELVAEREENARLAVADERARIARELHDAVAHSLSVMVVQAGAARRALETSAAPGAGDAAAADAASAASERARGALAAIEATGRDTLAEMRRVVGALRPAGGESYEPQPSLDELDRLLTTVRGAGLPVELVVEGEVQAVPRSVDLSAYRVIQEALTNTLKHAGPARALVTVRYGPGEIEVEVVDDGTPPGPAGRGHGLLGMQERAAVVGGRVETGPRSGHGYAVRASLPT
jgi:signal transduction histidine kinase